MTLFCKINAETGRRHVCLERTIYVSAKKKKNNNFITGTLVLSAERVELNFLHRISLCL